MASAANPHAANPPAVTIPEPLPLPVAVVIVAAIGRRTVIAVAGSVIARPIIAGARKRAADDGAADDAASHRCAETALCVSRGGGSQSRNGQGCGGCESHQCLPHGFTFLIRKDSGELRSVIGEGSIPRLNAQ